MPYCPKCRYEYKPEVEICPDCGEELVIKQKSVKKERPISAKRVTPKGEPKLKLRYVTKNLIYANFLMETLEKNKIPCIIRRESGVNLRGPALIRHPPTDTKIYVREEDFKKSLKIKEQLLDNFKNK